jgi:ABC-type sugar transport system ATPase subunit
LGKTTTLRMVVGWNITGADFDRRKGRQRTAADDRGIAMVFQNYAL